MGNPATGSNATASGFDIVPVTPDDDVDLATPARGVRCKPITGGAGTLRVTTRQGEVRNTEIAQGEQLNVFVTRIHSAGTTATGLEALI
ncbi:hypothetical protein IWQ49_006377 [Labrenzia sp. EL_126]|nr:hypothetical protein [Labrenzia sp. EL_126]